jgi:poly(hydroxyalkanoate) depolymerase family esterase
VALQQVTAFGANPAGFRLYEFAPANAKTAVVALHGCMQTADSFADSGVLAVAKARGVRLLLPEQVIANNASQCFRWYEPSQVREGGEELTSLRSVLAHARSAGATRVGVLGFSAGAAMAVAIAARLPTEVEAVSVFAGIPYGCATGLTSAFGCMAGNTSKSPAEWGTLITSGQPNVAYPRMHLWQGLADKTVAAANIRELEKQWAQVLGLSSPMLSSESGDSLTTYKNRAGKTGLLVRTTPRLDHAMPQSAQDCGEAVNYTQDVGTCGAQKAFDFLFE